MSDKTENAKDELSVPLVFYHLDLVQASCSTTELEEIRPKLVAMITEYILAGGRPAGFAEWASWDPWTRSVWLDGATAARTCMVEDALNILAQVIAEIAKSLEGTVRMAENQVDKIMEAVAEKILQKYRTVEPPSSTHG